MIKTLLPLLFTFISLNVFSQSFEGRVIYKVKYKSKVQGFTETQLADLLGTTQEYFIKGGDYYSKMNGTMYQWQLYTANDNRYYLKLGNSDKVYGLNASVNKDPATLLAHNKGVEEILGYKCDELIFENRSGIHKYYFSSDIPLDSKLFVNHKYGNWHEYLSKANAVPLKEIVDSKELILESIATEVSREKIDGKIFSLPEGIAQAEMPF